MARNTDFGGLAGISMHNTGGQPHPPLQRIHPDTTYLSGTAKLAVEYWRKQPTDVIVRSLAAGAGRR